jgi:hypothetical protein
MKEESQTETDKIFALNMRKLGLTICEAFAGYDHTMSCKESIELNAHCDKIRKELYPQEEDK